MPAHFLGRFAESTHLRAPTNDRQRCTVGMKTQWCLLVGSQKEIPAFCQNDEAPLLLATVDNLQLVSLKNTSYLVAGVHRPGTSAVELQVGSPVGKCLSRLTQAFIRERQVVMGISIGGSQLNRGAIGYDCFLDPTCFIQNIAEIEVSQGITRVQP